MYSLILGLKKYCFLLAVVLLLGSLICTAWLYFPTQSQASLRNDAAMVQSVKCYKSIEIPNHVSLWQIAKTHMTEEYRSVQAYIHEVKQINHLKTNQIISGSYLVIPYYQD